MNYVTNDFSWKIAGGAGDGILNAGFVFAKSCLLGGLYTFATAEYPSLIRGGHDHLDVRVAARPVYSHSRNVNILVALNEESAAKHARKLVPGGGIIYDGDEISITAADIGRSDVFFFPLPLLKFANECGGMIMRNVVALGATFALVDFNLPLLNSILEKNLSKKGQQTVENNIKAAKAGYGYVKNNFANILDSFPFRLRQLGGKKNIFLSGNEAITVGAIKAGCKFFAGYPMTPASSVMHNMAANEKQFGIIVKHTEDEIAAVNMAIGAAFAGVRAMTATSGGGFCLMSEGLGLAAQTETPLVIVEAQRPGPATGMATHSSQGDLLFMLHAGTDEAPRFVIAPGDVQECFYYTIMGFNLAEKYQMPAIILTDKFLGESYCSTGEFDCSGVSIGRGALLSEEEAANASDYKRYRLTESGISPRAVPGQKNCIFTASSYEHDEEGFEREEEHIRMAVHEKRFRKFALAAKEILEPQLVGPENAQVTLFCWGSTKGPALEAMKLLAEEGFAANMLHTVFLSPFPAEKIKSVMEKSRMGIIIEGNRTAQFASLVKRHTGKDFHYKILKYDGRPFNPEGIAAAVKDIILHKAERIIVLNGWQEAVKVRSEEELAQLLQTADAYANKSKR